MLRFAANLTMLFSEQDFISRFTAAAKSGFSGVEYLFPYAFAKDQLVNELGKNNLKQVLHNLPAGNWEAGDRGIACDPQREAEFREGVDLAIEYATALKCGLLNCLVGIKPSLVSTDKANETIIKNLKYAAPRLESAGIKLLVEPVNTYDIPGFFLNRSAQTLQIIDAVSHPNLFLQYDIYHMQMMEGNLASTIKANFDRIRHIQVADVPGRHEPGSGEIRFDFLFEFLDNLGYDGWIGCEYKPAADTKSGLKWMEAYQAVAS